MGLAAVRPKPKKLPGVSPLAAALHDLKGFLAVAGGQARLIQAGRLGPVTAAQNEALADILTGCRQIEEQIVRQLSSEARPGGENEWKPVLKKTDIRKCLLDAFTLMRPEFLDAQITFEVQSWDGPLRVPYDARLIRRVLLNLLENARRFTAAGGMVTISVAPEFWERRNQKYRQAFTNQNNKIMAPNCVKIVVADTGCGIEESEYADIFEEYYSTAAPGTCSSSGLGLAISRKIVVAHGGKIWVESKPGEGSRFCFYLPFVAPSEGVFLDDGEEM